MRKRVWIVRLALLLVAGALGAVAVEARRADLNDLRTARGLTGQRQAIEFEIDADGGARAFGAVLYLHCSGGSEWNITWSPGDGSPVPFEWRGERLRVREESGREYGDGTVGRGVATMYARAGRQGLEGRMRAVWRFERKGSRHMVCDSGHVPFAVGPGAPGRLERIPRSAEPWSLYPEDEEVAAPTSVPQARFTDRVDRACLRTWHERPATGRFADYVRWHAWQWSELARLGLPPQRRVLYRRWLGNMKRRTSLERDALEALRRDDLETAARIEAEVSALKARGNADGLRAGLLTCTGNGPTGAPKS